MLSKSEIQAELGKALEELFDLPLEKITPGARLAEDLDLDSIDAIYALSQVDSRSHESEGLCRNARIRI